MKYKYPLQKDNFSFWDRIKACAFILNKDNRLTCGPKTKELETAWEDIVGGKAIATSSGSTANHLLVETFIQNKKLNPNKVVVFAPSTTWSSSITPWLMRGCKVIFIDINLEDFSFDYDKLEERVGDKEWDGLTKVIWPTALIGSVPDILKLKKIKRQNKKTFLFGDFCETSIGSYKDKHCISHFDMATTSFFWAHEICGIELGMLFINDAESSYISTAHTVRSHGLTRVLPAGDRQKLEAKYDYIDKEFLFVTHGTNYRPSDLNSFFCLVDSKRYDKYEKQRKEMWAYFLERLPNNYMQVRKDMVPFCLPLIAKKGSSRSFVEETKSMLNGKGWETRPVISFIPLNPAFGSDLTAKKVFPNSNFLHENGFYVGLNPELTKDDVDELMEAIK